MGFKLGSYSGKAILIKDDKYFDVNEISNASISSNSIEALENENGLSELYKNVNVNEAAGSIDDIVLDPPVILSLIHI